MHDGESLDASFFARPQLRQLVSVSTSKLPVKVLNPTQTQQLFDFIEKLQYNQYDAPILIGLLDSITLDEDDGSEQPSAELSLFSIMSSQPESVINQLVDCLINVLKRHIPGLQEDVEMNFILFLKAFKLISFVLSTEGPHLLETHQQRTLYTLIVEGLGQSNMAEGTMPTGSLFQLKYEVQRECNQTKASLLQSTSLSQDLSLFKFGINYLSAKLRQLEAVSTISVSDKILHCF